MSRYRYKPFAYETPPELSGGRQGCYPVVIVGAGPIGLSAAIDLALHGIKCVVLDDNNVVSTGSRAICWSKRTLEIFDRLGVGERMVEKGITWKVGRLFRGETEVYSFDLLPEDGHKMPAFINLQQYHVEHYLVERCADFPGLIDLRWKNRVTDVEQSDDRVLAMVETPEGNYRIESDFLLACDGAGSPVRSMLGLDFEGRCFEERFLIADVEMQADFPSERWFWFEPPFHSGQSALLHKQPDNIYRIDLQLGPDADPEMEKRPKNVVPRIKAMLGDRKFEIDWVSVYTFQCRRMMRFVHDRVIFAGDSAHIVSPFGARGGNGGIQDVDNLCWKLAAVLRGEAGDGLIESYNDERVRGADENILNSARSTSFMTPKSDMEKTFRDAVLDLAAEMPFARRLVNSGRLSVPCSLEGLPLQTPAEEPEGLEPGLTCLDAPVVNSNTGWLLDHLGGRFVLLSIGDPEPVNGVDGHIDTIGVATGGGSAGRKLVALRDKTGLAEKRYGAGCHYLVRPDQHIAARFRTADAAAINTAYNRAMGRA